MILDRIPFLRRVLESPVTLGVAIVLIIAVSLTLTRELLRRSATQADIARLQSEAVRLEAQRRDLEDLLSFLNSETFVEEEARVKLNLQKPGETVVIVPSSTASTASAIDATVGLAASNPSRWWSYFFKQQ